MRATHKANQVAEGDGWRRRQRHGVALWLIAASTLTPVWMRASHAAGLEVSPTSLHIAPQQRADGISLRNTGSTPMFAQVRVYRWTQENGQDVLVPTTELTISPPVLNIAGDTHQLVRVIRTGAPEGQREERAYRLIVDELPRATAPLDSAKATASTASPQRVHSELSFLMRYSLPVFLGAPEHAYALPTLRWSAREVLGRWHVAVQNDGAFHAQIADLRAVLADGSKPQVMGGLMGYALPGMRKEWDISAPAFSAPITGYEALINRSVRAVSIDFRR